MEAISMTTATETAPLGTTATGADFPWRELTLSMTCGILAAGFARVHCSGCGKDELVAFSCKGRAFCPSCGGRRMADLAAQLCDRLLPGVPIRQWVLTFPWKIRFLLASRP